MSGEESKVYMSTEEFLDALKPTNGNNEATDEASPGIPWDRPGTGEPTGKCHDECPGGHKEQLLVSLQDTTTLLTAMTYEGFLQFAAALFGGGIECFRDADGVTEEMWADWSILQRVHEVAGVLISAELYADREAVRQLRAVKDLNAKDYDVVVFRDQEVQDALETASALLIEAHSRDLTDPASPAVERLLQLSDRWVNLARLRGIH